MGCAVNQPTLDTRREVIMTRASPLAASARFDSNPEIVGVCTDTRLVG